MMADVYGTVPLRVAYAWTCDHCGRDSFAEAAAMDMPREEKIAQLRHMGMLEPHEDLPDEMDGEFVTQPTHVTCTHCNRHYQTEETG